jgi:uncharacterized membrane protein
MVDWLTHETLTHRRDRQVEVRLLIDNSYWMGFNVLLACLAVPLGYLMVLARSRLARLIFGALWLLFLPNTLYVVTDLYHLSYQWHAASTRVRPLLLAEYGLLVLIGVATFFLAVYPFERLLGAGRRRWSALGAYALLVLLNFAVAFGVAMGRFQRTNSWDVFLDTEAALYDALAVMASHRLILFVFVFGLAANALYFGLRGVVANRLRNFAGGIVRSVGMTTRSGSRRL